MSTATATALTENCKLDEKLIKCPKLWIIKCLSGTSWLSAKITTLGGICNNTRHRSC